MGETPNPPARMGVLRIALICVGSVLLLLPMVRVGVTYVNMGRSPRYAEARSNLKTIHIHQKAFDYKLDRYARRIHELGLELERGNRYAYFLLPSGPIELRDGAVETRNEEAVILWADRSMHPNAPGPTDAAGTGCPVTLGKDLPGNPVGVGVWGTRPNEVFIALAAGNLDDDPMLDCWTIASMPRVDANGDPIPEGTPYREQDDTSLTKWQRIRVALLGPLSVTE